MAEFERALAELTGQPIRVEFALVEDASDEGPSGPAAEPVSRQQRILEMSQHPMIRRAAELFGAEPTDVRPPNGEKALVEPA